MPHVHDSRDLKIIAQQIIQINNQATRIEDLETQLAALRDPLSTSLAMDGLRLAFENESLQRSIATSALQMATEPPELANRNEERQKAATGTV